MGPGPLVIAAVVVRPWLWRDALGLALAFAARRWWGRSPWLPVPDRDYVRWRLQTAYGGDGTTPPGADETHDLLSLVRFRRELRRSG